METKTNFKRLRKDIFPINYDLEIFTEFDTFKFQGKVNIQIKVIILFIINYVKLITLIL